MSDARPRTAWLRGIVGSVLLVALSACSDAVPIDDPVDPSTSQAEACESLVDALPDTLADESRREVSPQGALGAAWGDPAYVVTCGAAEPADYDPFAQCQEVNGVGWFVPMEQFETDHQRDDVTLTTIGRSPRVSLTVPGAYRPDGVAAALADLAGPIKRTLTLEEPCLRPPVGRG